MQKMTIINSTMKVLLLFGILLTSKLLAQETNSSELILPDQTETPRMKAWRDMHYGMFIHFNINTFLQLQGWKYSMNNLKTGNKTLKIPPPDRYAPKGLDVDSWVKLAKDAGMKYAVLTTKHNPGFCIWDSKVMWNGKEFDYDIGSTDYKTDVVRLFLDACKKYGIAPGFYYNIRDAHAYPEGYFPKRKMDKPLDAMTDDYFKLVKDQVKELTTLYPECHYYWFDHPTPASTQQLAAIYETVRSANPNNIVLFNDHLAVRSRLSPGGDHIFDGDDGHGFPADVVDSEGKPTEKPVAPFQIFQGKKYFIGYEACATAGEREQWFDPKTPKSVSELFDLYKKTRACGGNLLLDVGPTEYGVVAPAFQKALLDLKVKIDDYEKTSDTKSGKE